MKQICTLLICILIGGLAVGQTAPTVPASNIRFTSVDGGSMTIAFDIGNGAYRIVVVKEGSPVTGIPENGKEYPANASFATPGTEFTAAGEYVVLKNSWNSVTIDKLKPATTYYAAVFEYNGTGAAARYLVLPVTGSKATVSAPGMQAGNLTVAEITGNSVKLGWTNGNGAGRLILAHKASPVNADPVDLKAYYPYNSGEFGTGNVINGDNYAVYRGNGNAVTITKLEPNTPYYFSIYEYNGNTTPVYVTPAGTGNVTTNTGPTKPTQSIVFSGTEGNRLTVGCSAGNGSKRLIIARKGSPVTAVPVNGTVYTANAAFGAGQQIAPAEYVVSNSSANNVIVTNLDPGTVYYFRIVEFDETAGNFPYYLNTPMDGSKSTAVPPTTIASNLTVSNITGSTATINFTPGNGNYRLAVVKEGSAVNAVPQDLTLYSGNLAFGTGTQVAPGTYAVAGQMNGAGFTLNTLKAGYTYQVGIYEFNGTNYPVYNTTPATVGFSIPLEPTQAAASFSQLSKDGDRMRVVWTNGNGGKRIVIARKGMAVTYKPIDGTNYTANSIFAQGTQVAAGEYVVYDGSSAYFDMTGLEIGATYYFAVFEYNTSDAGVNDFLTASFLTGNASTATWPTTQTSALNATNIQATQATINFTAGNGGNRLFFMKAGSPVDADPSLVTGSSGYGLGYGTVQVGSTGNYFVFRTNGAGPFTVTSLAPNTTYYVSGFEYNGSSAPAYLVPGGSCSFTTPDVPGATTPTVAASAPLVSAVDGNKFNFKWTNGNGAGRIVVMRAGSAVNFTPTSATGYPANAAFGTGTNLGNDQYVVYAGAGNSVSITNLLPATTYYLTVFEYNGTGTLLRYLTGSVLNATGVTAAAPTVAASNAFITTTGNSMTLNWTNGNGENRLVVVKKGSTVLAAPVDLSVYPANTVFKAGSQVAVNEYVVYAGNGNGVTVTGLTPGDVYYYKVFEYNGSTGPVYNTSSVLSGSVATGSLPVTWLYFNATQKNDKVLLAWGTSAEVNSAWFVVERSVNGIDFQEAGRVAGSRNTGSDKQYTFSDPVTGSQKRCYRLKQIDIDGAFTYSKVVTVQTAEQAMVTLQPNPVQHVVRIQLPDGSQQAMLTIYNAAGIPVQRETITNWQPVNVQRLTAGSYYLQIRQGNKLYSLAMTKL